MSRIEIIYGSCLNQEADAIVNAANGYMSHGAGIARAILMKAGPELNEACREYKLPINDGNVIVTPAFNIKNAKIVIHAVGPDFGSTPHAFKELFNAYYNSLIALKDNNYHTISFPLISSSIFGGNLPNPVRESVKQCLRAYNSFVKKYKDYNIDVKLCIYSQKEVIQLAYDKCTMAEATSFFEEGDIMEDSNIGKIVVDKMINDESRKLIDLLRECNIDDGNIMLTILGIGSHTEYYNVLINRINNNKDVVNDDWLKKEALEIFHEIDRNE